MKSSIVGTDDYCTGGYGYSQENIVKHVIEDCKILYHVRWYVCTAKDSTEPLN